MKKVLILLLVLGLATAANAITLDISVHVGDEYSYPDEITICVGDHVTLDIWASGYVDSPDNMYWALVVSQTYGSIGQGTIIQPPAPSMSTLDGTSAADDWFPGLEGDEDGPWGGIAGTPAGETAPAGVYFDYFDFECLAEGDSIVRLISTVDFDSYIVQDTVIIHQVPEPASMLLLGLGGLLLRRRK